MSISNRFTFFALLATLLVGTGVAFSQRADRSQRPTRRIPLPVEDSAGRLNISQDGAPARATRGKLVALDVLRTVGVLSGHVLMYPSALDDPMFREDVTVELLEGVDNFSLPVARVLLESNGYQFYEEELADGQVILHCRHMHSRTSPPPPQPAKVYGPSEEIPSNSPYRFETAIIALEHADPSAVVSTLRNHLKNLEGSRTQQIATTGGTRLMVTGTRRMLRHVRELCGHLDVEPYRQPKPRGATPEEPAKKQ
ncbi:MAG: hypothetical protein AAF488_07035 [Planctomycetota bacterium]